VIGVLDERRPFVVNSIGERDCLCFESLLKCREVRGRCRVRLCAYSVHWRVAVTVHTGGSRNDTAAEFCVPPGRYGEFRTWAQNHSPSTSDSYQHRLTTAMLTPNTGTPRNPVRNSRAADTEGGNEGYRSRTV